MKKILFSLFLIIALGSANSNAEIKPIIDGNKDAKIKIVVYESLTCSHCANFHKNVYPKLKKDFLDKDLASIEYRNFPLDMAAFNASKIAHCKNDGNSDILHYLFENQEQWIKGKSIDELNQNIKTLIEKSNYNLDSEKCLNDKNVENHILEDRIEGAKKFKIEATPTLIINDEKFENPSNYKKLKKYLEKLI